MWYTAQTHAVILKNSSYAENSHSRTWWKPKNTKTESCLRNTVWLHNKNTYQWQRCKINQIRQRKTQPHPLEDVTSIFCIVNTQMKSRQGDSSLQFNWSKEEAIFRESVIDRFANNCMTYQNPWVRARWWHTKWSQHKEFQILALKNIHLSVDKKHKCHTKLKQKPGDCAKIP